MEMRATIKIIDRIRSGLRDDGFSQAAPAIFVRAWKGDWRGWIGISGNSYILCPTVGVFNQELLDIRSEALSKIGHKPNYVPGGPPLIMVNLEQLGKRAEKKMPWHYNGEVLSEKVADDLVYWIKKDAYPFIENHCDFHRILESVSNGQGSHAMPFYLPIILIKLRRTQDLDNFAKAWKKQYKNDELAVDYDAYVNALLEIVDPDPTPQTDAGEGA